MIANALRGASAPGSGPLRMIARDKPVNDPNAQLRSSLRYVEERNKQSKDDSIRLCDSRFTQPGEKCVDKSYLRKRDRVFV